MDNISTIMLVRALSRRLYNFRVNGVYDTFFAEMCDVDEQAVVDLDSSLTNILDIYDEDVTLRMIEWLETADA